MTVDEIIEGILVSEGPGDAEKDYHTPGDLGGRTNWGISERSHPDEWRNGKVPSRERAKEIYTKQYVTPWMGVIDHHLFAMLVDMTVLHGVRNVRTMLQQAIGPYEPGKERTLLNAMDPRVIINCVVAYRCAFMANIAEKKPLQRQFFRGWINRAVKFLA